MISSGVILYLYSNVITGFRLSSTSQIASFQNIRESQGIGGTLSSIHTMFAGMLLEVLFLVSCSRMYIYTSAGTINQFSFLI